MRNRTATSITTAIVAVALTGCGSAQPGTAASEDLEKATTAGIAAAVITHLDTDSVLDPGGAGNAGEGWQAVQMKVKVDGRKVPLDVMVAEYPEDEAGRPTEADLCGGGSWVLSCQGRTLEDGSTLLRMASTEDIVGGRMRTGFMAFVGHYRDDHVVLVMETLPSRESDLVELRGLPLDVELLEDIATDPMVGTRTSAALNEAGADIPGFAMG